jgi:hypothetical protein
MSISFDSNPIIYWIIGYALALLLCVFIYLCEKKQEIYEGAFLALSTFLIAFMRLPVLLFNRELNADESQMLAQAMTLFKDPVYFRSVDGTTGGPLGSYFLIIPSLFTGAFDYTSSHLGSILLVFVTLSSFYFALRNWFGNIVAMAAIYPMTLFFAFTQQQDFVHYSSEHVPMALMGIIAFLLSIYFKSPSRHHFSALLLGCFVALLPFGKLQTLPMVAVLVLWALYVFWERKTLFSEGLLFISGGIVTLSVIALLLFSANVFDDFITFYIIGNFQYGGEISWLDNLLDLPSGLLRAPAVFWFIVPQVAFAIFFIWYEKRNKFTLSAQLILPLVWLLFTLLAISRTGSGYLHYWLFALIPIILLFANYLALFTGNINILIAFCFLSLACVVLPKAGKVLQKEVVNLYPSDSQLNRDIPFTAVAKEVLKYGKKGEYLVVWGWNCQFYIETQMPQGVAENHSIRSIFRHPMQNVYLERYAKNIVRNRPVVILDAVGKNSLWVQDKDRQGLDNYPVLFNYISANYKLAETVDDARIYVRNDLLNSR